MLIECHLLILFHNGKILIIVQKRLIKGIGGLMKKQIYASLYGPCFFS